MKKMLGYFVLGLVAAFVFALSVYEHGLIVAAVSWLIVLFVAAILIGSISLISSDKK